MRIFKILNSESLPPFNEREENTIYFLYDKLDIYFYQTQYTGLYSIVPELPSLALENKPFRNMLYITMEGGIYTYNADNSEDWKQIAEIDDPTQLIYLVEAGTTFLLKSGYRYIDSQTKVIDLPYQNGTFQLSVMVDKPIQINKNTIIIYNEETGQWEIDGDRYYDEFGRNPEIMKYSGVETNSVITNIFNEHISADVKLSNRPGNTLSIKPDGLYVTERDYASVDQFNQLVTRAQAQMTAFNRHIEDMTDALEHIDITLDDESLHDKIMEVLEEYKPTLNTVIDDYEQVVAEFEVEKTALITQINSDYMSYMADTMERIQRLNRQWEYFIDTFDCIIVKDSDDHYQVNVGFPIEDFYALYYKLGKEYIATDENIASLGFTEFNDGSILEIEDDAVFTVVYAYVEDDKIYAKRASYCVAAETPTE